VSFGSVTSDARQRVPVDGTEPVELHGSRGGQVSTGTFVKNADGSVDLSVQVTGLTMAYADGPISIGLRMGDDFGFNPGSA
jgi:hypothetical protein